MAPRMVLRLARCLFFLPAALLASCGGPAPSRPLLSASPTPTTYAQKLLGGLERSAVERTRSDMMAIATAIGAYSASAGNFPEAMDLDALNNIVAPTYIHILPHTDAWGQTYLFLGTPDAWSLTAPGPDGQVKTDDDIVLTDRGFTKLPSGYKPL